MIPTLIGFFIVAVLAASLMDTMNLNLKEAGNAREIANAAESARQVLNVLRDPSICTNNFRGKPAGADSTIDSIRSDRSGSPQILIEKDKPIPSTTLNLKTIRLHDYRAYTTGAAGPDLHGTMELDLVYEAPQGGVARRRAILISTELDASNNIKTCLALGTAADYWKLTTASDIWYNGKVAVGDTSVPTLPPGEAPYVMYIAGYVQSDDYYHVSDRRAKTHIRPLDANGDLAGIRGVRYKWRANDRPAMGVLAQDVERAYPSAVSGRSPETMKAVDYDQLIAPLIERVNALADQNRDLALRLERLRAQIGP